MCVIQQGSWRGCICLEPSVENTGAGSSPGFGSLLQGFLETSNVNAVEEISALIVAQRAYEMNAKVITASDEMLQTATQVR